MRLFRETTWASVVSLSFLSWSSSSCKLPPPPVPACSRSSFAPPPTSYSRPSCGAAAGRLQSERPAALWTPCCTPEHQASLWRPCSTGPAWSSTLIFLFYFPDDLLNIPNIPFVYFSDNPVFSNSFNDLFLGVSAIPCPFYMPSVGCPFPWMSNFSSPFFGYKHLSY